MSREHLLSILASQVLDGLSFLHLHGKAHSRDLKPANILARKQQYCSLPDDTKDRFWKESPIEGKFTDFGECWANKMDEESAKKIQTT